MIKYSKNHIWGILRDAQTNTQKILLGEPTRPTNTLKILPGVFVEYFLNKNRVAASGRALWDLYFTQKILQKYSWEYFQSIFWASWLSPEVFFEYFFEHPSEYPKQYFWSILSYSLFLHSVADMGSIILFIQFCFLCKCVFSTIYV